MARMPELRRLLRAKSISRWLVWKGTAGLAVCRVSGARRLQLAAAAGAEDTGRAAAAVCRGSLPVKTGVRAGTIKVGDDWGWVG